MDTPAPPVERRFSDEFDSSLNGMDPFLRAALSPEEQGRYERELLAAR